MAGKIAMIRRNRAGKMRRHLVEALFDEVPMRRTGLYYDGVRISKDNIKDIVVYIIGLKRKLEKATGIKNGQSIEM